MVSKIILDLYFSVLYPSANYEWNWSILSKVIDRKPRVLTTPGLKVIKLEFILKLKIKAWMMSWTPRPMYQPCFPNDTKRETHCKKILRARMQHFYCHNPHICCNKRTSKIIPINLYSDSKSSENCKSSLKKYSFAKPSNNLQVIKRKKGKLRK